MTRAAFSVGDEIAGTRVTEIMARGRTTPIPARLLAYRVTCLHCGHERIVRHVSLRERITRGSVDCNSCKGLKADATSGEIQLFPKWKQLPATGNAVSGETGI